MLEIFKLAVIQLTPTLPITQSGGAQGPPPGPSPGPPKPPCKILKASPDLGGLWVSAQNFLVIKKKFN